MSKPNGGPAFPGAYIPERFEQWSGSSGAGGSYTPAHSVAGMTLRDYFAGQALKGLLGNDEVATARVAYRFADAMLAEREKT